MKEYLEDRVCNNLGEVCEEVKRQLRSGNQVEVSRYLSTPACFLVTSFVDYIPTRGGKDGMTTARVTGYFMEP